MNDKNECLWLNIVQDMLEELYLLVYLPYQSFLFVKWFLKSLLWNWKKFKKKYCAEVTYEETKILQLHLGILIKDQK